MFIAIRNLFNFLFFLIIDLFIGLRKNKVIPKTLLLLRLDSIGDFILFRNFIRLVKEDDKYKEYKITLCGSIIWKDLAETLDTDVIDDFIWLDRNKFLTNIVYKTSFLKSIYDKGFEIVINSTYTREILFGDQIVKSSRAKVKIGNSGSLNKTKKTRIFSDSFYSILINSSNRNLFEFDRNREFFEKLLDKNLSISKPIIEVGEVKLNLDIPEKYFVVFPGANHKSRMWAPDNFAEICKFLSETYNIPVLITASEKEKFLGEKIKAKSGTDKVIDFSGRTTLSQLAKIISGTELLITNDTGAVHIAASTDKPFICISNGNHFGRFTPYPKEIFNKGQFLYPSVIMDRLDKYDELTNEFHFGSNLNINEIKLEQVIEQIKAMLKEN